MKPGVKFMDLFCLKNIWETTLLYGMEEAVKEGTVIQEETPGAVHQW